MPGCWHSLWPKLPDCIPAAGRREFVAMPAVKMEAGGANAYEQERLARMKRNRERLEALSIPDLKGAVMPVRRPPAVKVIRWASMPIWAGRGGKRALCMARNDGCMHLCRP